MAYQLASRPLVGRGRPGPAAQAPQKTLPGPSSGVADRTIHALTSTKRGPDPLGDAVRRLPGRPEPRASGAPAGNRSALFRRAQNPDHSRCPGREHGDLGYG